MKINYFPHDCGASCDYKIAAIEAEFGTAGYAVFFKSIEILHTCKNGTLELQNLISGVKGLVRGEAIEVDNIIDACVRLGLLSSKNKNKIDLISSPRVKKNLQRAEELSEKNRANALRGAELRKKMSSDRSAPAQRPPAIKLDQIRLDQIKLDQNKESMSTVLSEPQKETQCPKVESCLIKYGELVFRTTEERKEKLVEKFSRPLFDQELPEMDLWLSESQTPSARRYRKPNFDHYLFANNWLKDKKLKYTSNNTNGVRIVEGESKFMKSVRRVAHELGLDENDKGEIIDVN